MTDVRLTLLGRRVGSLPALAPINPGVEPGYQKPKTGEEREQQNEQTGQEEVPPAQHRINYVRARYDGHNDVDNPFRRSLVFCHGLLLGTVRGTPQKYVLG